MLRSAPIVAFLLVTCTGTGHRDDAWTAGLARAHCTRADELLGLGQADAAREEAQRALTLARQQPSPGVLEARALRLLGIAEGSTERLHTALSRSTELGDEDGAARARLALAELALARDELPQALDWIDAVLDGLEVSVGTSLSRARAHHLRAEVMRAMGRAGDAARHEREAALVLSLLAPDEVPLLRLAVALALGDDLAAAGKADLAFGQHARASSLARLAGRQRDELNAVSRMADDLAAMTRWTDAADHLLRAFHIAVELADRRTATHTARRLLDILDHIEEHASLRRAELEAWLTSPGEAYIRFPPHRPVG